MWSSRVSQIALALAVILFVALGVAYYNSKTLEGVVVLEEVGAEATNTYVWTPALFGQRITHLEDDFFRSDISFARDGTRAELKKNGASWEVVLASSQSEIVLTQTQTIKRDLRWAANGLSLAYAEGDPHKNSLGNPDQWTVIRMLKDGSAIAVGTGIRPQPVAGSETLVLTRDGVARIRVGVPPELVIRSAKPIFDTPFAATGDGRYVAWVNPADKKLQLFELTAARAYTPRASLDVPATSLRFNHAGTQLLATVSEGSATSLVLVDLGGTTTKVGSMDGTVMLTDWYE